MKNQTKMRRSLKSRILTVVAALLLSAGVLTGGFVFMDFMDRTIYDESTAHLTEIYHQANQTLYNKVQSNRQKLRKKISSCWRARSCSQAFPATWTMCS